MGLSLAAPAMGSVGNVTEKPEPRTGFFLCLRHGIRRAQNRILAGASTASASAIRASNCSKLSPSEPEPCDCLATSAATSSLSRDFHGLRHLVS